jgi:hypothetical protein
MGLEGVASFKLQFRGGGCGTLLPVWYVLLEQYRERSAAEREAFFRDSEQFLSGQRAFVDPSDPTQLFVGGTRPPSVVPPPPQAVRRDWPSDRVSAGGGFAGTGVGVGVGAAVGAGAGAAAGTGTGAGSGAGVGVDVGAGSTVGTGVSAEDAPARGTSLFDETSGGGYGYDPSGRGRGGYLRLPRE